MTAPNVIKIDEIKYVRKDAIPVSDAEIKIVVLDRGFVYVGRPHQADGMLTINQARNVRQWGTTKGLAELTNGPTSKTVLDGSMTVRVHDRAVLQIIDVVQGPWTKHI